MKKVISLLLLITLLSFSLNISVSADSVFDGGDGTINNPYIITTADQLYEVRYNLDKHFIQMKDIDLSSATSEGGDYYDNGSGWLPIGDSSNSFTGTYNGNGYSIKGMNINRTSTYSLYVGLFSSVTGCVKNLTIENCSITATASGTYGSVYCGGLSAVMKDDAQIINCSVTGSITTSSTYSSLVGGIIGNTSGGTVSTIKIIKDCSTDLTLNVTAKASSGSGTISTGGLVGSGDSMEIHNCNSAGTIQVYADKTNYVGGILGKIYNDKLVMDWCSNNSQINVSDGTGSSNSSTYYVGGLVGQANITSSTPTELTMTISNSYNSGNVYSKAGYSSSGNYIGGIAGQASTAYGISSLEGWLYNGEGNIINCYNVGSITGEGSASNNNIGGIIGSNYKFNIISCYNSAPLSAKTSNSSASTPNVAAISGYSTDKTLVSNSYWNVSASQTINGNTLTDDKKIGVGPSSIIDTTTSMSPAKMRAISFVDNLNSYLSDQQHWKEDSDNINNGYPILLNNEEENTDEQITIQATANVVNNHIVIFVKSSKEVTDEMLHIALYSGDGRMIDYLIVPTVEAFDKTNVVFKDDVNIAKAKVFLWKSTTSITPLTNAIEINITR